MFETTTNEGRIISAALALAAEKSWSAMTLSEIAERASVTLVDLKGHFGSKGDILSAFTRLVDDEVLRRTPPRAAAMAPRDALFDVVMGRFDVLEPYKNALKSIASEAMMDPFRVPPFLTTQRWMLEAAGISAHGVDGGLRVAGLAAVYASVFRTWLEDDDAGLSRTMAALDRRLRRGEQALHRVAEVRGVVVRVADTIAGMFAKRTARPPNEAAAASPPPTAPPSGAPI